MGLSAESLQRELRTVFAHEVADTLKRVETLIERQRRGPADPGLLDALFREFHTMKVGAAAAGLPHAAHELHTAESLLEAARAGRKRLAEGEAIASLRRVVDSVRREVGEPGASLDACTVLPLAALWPHLSYATAVAAAIEHKLVALQAEPSDVMLDLVTADALRGALLHLVRNAVAHGIEPPDRRLAVGKPRVGCVEVRGDARGDALLVTVADDGAGLDFPAIATRAREHRLLAAAAEPTRDELTRLLLAPGFTTRREATELAGRGVGLDAVAEAARARGGQIEIESHDGAGCVVRVTLPLAGG